MGFYSRLCAAFLISHKHGDVTILYRQECKEEPGKVPQALWPLTPG